MTPEQLKASILQYAIQGKLVEQRPEEGTGEELYKQIQEEKQRLIKESKIKKEKPLPEITDDEIPFDIPESWKWVKVVDCVSNRTGLSYKKGNIEIRSEKMIRVLRGGNIYDMSYSFKLDDVMIASDFVKKELLLKRNTLITPAVTSLEHIGKIGRIDRDYFDVVVGGFVLMLIPHVESDVLSKYLLVAFSSHYFRNKCRQIVNKSGQAFYNISREKLMQLSVPLPPFEEQKRIVAKIEELLPYVDQYAIAYEKLEQLNAKFTDDMRKSILQYAIQGKLVEQRPEEGTGEELYHQIQEEKQRLIKDGKIKKEKPLPEITDNEIPFDIPESWKWVRWGALSFSIQYGYNAPAKKDGRIRMVRISDIQNGKVIWEKVPFCDIQEEEISTYLLAKNDILFARTGGTVGKSYIVKEIYKEAIYAGYLIRTRYSNILCPEYLYFFMQTQLYWDQLREGTIATAQPNCNGQKLSRMVLPLPPLAEQKRIVEKIEELLAICDRLKK